MLLLWFLLPSTATHCTLSLLLFPLPVVKFLPLLQTAVALLKVTSEIFTADSNPFLWPHPLWDFVLLYKLEMLSSPGSPWSGSLRCPPISSTILSLLPLLILVALQFPPKPICLPYIIYRTSYLFSWFQSHLGRLSNLHLQFQVFLNSHDKLLTQGSLGVYYWQACWHSIKGTLLAVYLCSVQLWEFHFLILKPSMAPSDSRRKEHSLQWYSGPLQSSSKAALPATHEHCLQRNLCFGKTPSHLPFLKHAFLPSCLETCFLPVRCLERRIILNWTEPWRLSPFNSLYRWGKKIPRSDDLPKVI